MLVLSRKQHEEIRIGDNIVISILSVRGQAVKVGISAPRDVAVHRSEVAQRIELESPSLLPTRSCA